MVLPLMVLVSGCSGGISQEDYSQLENEITNKLNTINGLTSDLQEAQAQVEELETQINELETLVQSLQTDGQGEGTATDGSLGLIQQLSGISAYTLWYDHYYGGNMFPTNINLFNNRMSQLLSACGDAQLRGSLQPYLVEDAPTRPCWRDCRPKPAPGPQSRWKTGRQRIKAERMPWDRSAGTSSYTLER
jgi:outer membrane murein-binding lipoprotein Lpp